MARGIPKQNIYAILVDLCYVDLDLLNNALYPSATEIPDNYYLKPKPKKRLLWNNRANDCDVPWSWHRDLIAYASRVDADERTIAAYILMETRKNEAEHHDIDH